MQPATSPRPFQFSLRMFLAVVTVIALLIPSSEYLAELAFEYFHLTTAVCAVITFGLAQYAQSTEETQGGRRWRWLITVVLLLVATYALWSHYRWTNTRRLDNWPQPLPYPDQILIAIHDWIDRTWPAPFGMIKIRGEYYTILECLRLTAWAFWTLFGLAFGLALPSKYRWLRSAS